MKKTGLFGGTFDPIHLGHINLAEQILQSGLVEQIIFIPAKYPPHKNPELISAREDRLAMLQIAIQGNSAFSYSDYELKQDGVSYTINTARYFAEKVDDLHIIMGVDSLLDLHKWVKSDELCSDHKFIFFKRPGYAISEEFKKNYNSEIADKLLSSILSAEELEISSSQIRLQIKSGQQANGLDPLVYDYIIKNNLYQEEK